MITSCIFCRLGMPVSAAGLRTTSTSMHTIGVTQKRQGGADRLADGGTRRDGGKLVAREGHFTAVDVHVWTPWIVNPDVCGCFAADAIRQLA